MKFSNFKKGFLVILVAFLALGSTACQQKHSNKARYLFVLSAASGVISDTQHGYTLTLNNVDPHILWFTDRPQRKAGAAKTQQFLAAWSQNFKGSNPNAAIVHADVSAVLNGKQQPMAFELANPQIHHGEVTFTISILSNDRIIPGQLKSVKLFIDSFQAALQQFNEADRAKIDN